ncbi:hypothetical protein A2U01_0090996, partial [Trifolium medium]|nr:hypothetical protein [Trifolium medium]
GCEVEPDAAHVVLLAVVVAVVLLLLPGLPCPPQQGHPEGGRE